MRIRPKLTKEEKALNEHFGNDIVFVEATERSVTLEKFYNSRKEPIWQIVIFQPGSSSWI